MPRFLVTLFLCAFLISSAVPTHSYTLRYNNSASAPLRWGSSTITIALSPSLSSPPANIKAGSDVVGAVRRALAQWESAGNVRFVETSSSGQSIGEGNVSLITVADTSANRNYAGSVALGRTSLTFDPATGIISRADIVINPAKQFSTDGSTGFDLETTFAHEIGHLLGLGHSALVSATMNANQGENPTYNLPANTGRSLSEDDRAGARAIYGAPTSTGAISGIVRDAGGAPVFGAHVWAEETASGKVAAGNVTFSGGSYRIGGLPSGTYRLRVEALDGLAPSSGIVSGSSTYAGLGASSFRTFEVPGDVSVSSSETTASISLPGGNVSFNPQIIGVRNGDVINTSTFAVPFAPGTTRIVYVFGAGMSSVGASGISITSPYLTIDPTTYAQGVVSINGQNTEGIRFDVTARADAPGGDYSIRLQSNSGEIAYIPGALTIEPNANNAAPAEVQTELRAWTVNGASNGYVKLTFPNATYRVTNYGQVARNGSELTVDAVIARDTSTPSVALTTATIYDLGALAPGTYTFTFRSNLSASQSATFTVGGAAAPNPIDDARQFARQQYLDFLNREPDTPGLDHWTGEITVCGVDAACIDRKRVNTSGAFFLSLEHQATGYYVYRLYKGALGRQPYLAEFTPDARAVAQGIVVNNTLSPDAINANKATFAQQFTERAEFTARYPVNLDAAGYVTRLTQTTGITLPASDQQALVQGLGNGTETRATVLQKIVDGQQARYNSSGGVEQVFTNSYGEAFYNQEYNRAFVLMQYFGYLRRDPDQAGYEFWLAKLNRFGNFIDAEMVKAFIVSSEYRSRFGQP